MPNYGTPLLEVDWAGNGSFSDAGDDISADLRAVSTHRGRDYASQLTGRSSAGTLQATLNNFAGTYSSFNASSPIYGNILPGRSVRLRDGTPTQRDAANFAAASSQYFSHADNAALSANDQVVEICAWVKLASLPGSGSSYFIGGKAAAALADGAGDEFGLIVRNQGGTVRFRFGIRADDDSTGTTAVANNFGTPSTGVWYFVHGWFENATQTVGIQVNNGTASTGSTGFDAPPDGSNPFTVGASATPASYFDGLITGLGFWKHATALLSSLQLAWLYNAGVGRSFSEFGVSSDDGAGLLANLVSYWELTDASGADAYGGNDLTNNNGVSTATGLTQLVYTTLWSGFLNRIEPQVTAGALPMATLYADGPIIKLTGKLISPAAQEGVFTGDVVNAILAAAGWGGASSVDSGSVPIGNWAVDAKDAFEAIQEMEEAEVGFFLEAADGSLRFEGRYNRYIGHDISLATFSDDPAAALPYIGVEQQDPLREIFNEITASVQNYIVGSLGVLWTFAGAHPVIAHGQSLTLIAQYTDGAYVNPWTTPVVGTDITQTGVSNGDLAISVVKGAKSMAITITNNHATASATLTLVQSRGVPITTGDPFQVISDDATSQSKFGLRTYPLPSPWYETQEDAQDSCDYFIAVAKDPRPILTLTFKPVEGTDLFAQCIARDLSDRVTVVANGAMTELGIDGDFYIESIDQTFQQGAFMQTVFTLSAAPSFSFWILGAGLLGTSTQLAY